MLVVLQIWSPDAERIHLGGGLQSRNALSFIPFLMSSRSCTTRVSACVDVGVKVLLPQ